MLNASWCEFLTYPSSTVTQALAELALRDEEAARAQQG